MRKLTLDPDTLKVESFTADATSPVRTGTVRGQEFNNDPWSTWWDCPTKGTCIGPTYCCDPTWQRSCFTDCIYCTS